MKRPPRLLAVILLLFVAVGCGSSSSESAQTDVETTTTVAAPATTAATTTTALAESQSANAWGVGTVDLPETVEEIAAVFDAMPASVAGFTRLSEGDGEHGVDYGEGGPSLIFMGGEQLFGMGGEPATPAEWLTLIAGSDELDIIGSDLESSVMWVHGSTQADDETEYALMVGEADGSALFVLSARSQDDLDSLIEAFVNAANG